MEQEKSKVEIPGNSKAERQIPPLPPPKNKKRNLYLILGIAATIFWTGVILWYIHYAQEYESTDDAFIDGYVTQISSRVPGEIERLLVTDNQLVKKGDVLVEIDPRDFDASLAQARAELAMAKSQLDQSHAQVKVNEAKVAQAQAAVVAAQAEAQRAANDLQRYQSVEAQAISKSAFDSTQAQSLSGVANVDAAKSQVQAAQAEVDLSQTGVELATAAVQQAQAKLDQAQLNFSYTKIIAPMDARVTARTVQPGNYVQPGQALMALVPRDLWVTANFKETQLTHMHPGQSVDLVVDIYPGRKFKGHVDSLQAGSGARFSLLPPENAVGNYIKVVQRVPVKIVFDKPLPDDLDIAPGMSVDPNVKVK
jgi:membrane fusion protein (multidrug efflux system)